MASPVAAPMSPLGFSASANFDDWLDFGQAGEPLGLGDQDISSFFPHKLDFADTDQFSYDALLQASPSMAAGPSSYTLDPSALMGAAVTQQQDIDSPLTFSPSSASSIAHHLSDVHPSESGGAMSHEHSPAAGAGAATATAANGDAELAAAIPLAVDPQLTAPQRPARPSDQADDIQVPPAARARAPPVAPIPEESEDDDMEDQASSPAVTPSSPTAAKKKQQNHPHALVEVPEWDDKPSAEEYKKLSSKEKRQLRNKISARNFRHRRKEHISTLEQQVAQRDELIASLRTDLSAVKAENSDLRCEVDLLKSKWSDLMKKIDEMSIASPASSAATAAQSQAGPSSPRPRVAARGSSSAIPKPNMYKDIGSHSMKAFNGGMGMMGGNVNVHTALIPEVRIDPYSRKNINPGMNTVSDAQRVAFDKGLFTKHLRGSVGAAGLGATDDFLNSNPHHLSPQALLEMKRQMYGKLAHNAPALLVAQKDGECQVPEGFKPAFFSPPAVAPTNPTLAPATSKATPPAPAQGREPRDVESALSSSSTLPTAAVLLEQEAAERRGSQQEVASYVFAAAASTLLTRMTSLFLNAFKVDGELDTAKMASVLEGKSELRVAPCVSSSPPPPYTSQPPSPRFAESVVPDFGLESLASGLRGLSFGGGDRERERLTLSAGLGVRACAMSAWAARRDSLVEEERARSPAPAQ